MTHFFQEELARQLRAIATSEGTDELAAALNILLDFHNKVPGVADLLREKYERAQNGSSEKEIGDLVNILMPSSAEEPHTSGKQSPPPHSRQLEKPPADDSFFAQDIKKAELEAKR